MIKLSELNGRVSTLNTTANSIETKLDAFIAGQGDPAIPADAEAAIDTLGATLTRIEGKIPPPPTP